MLNLHMVLWLPQSTQFNQKDAMIYIFSKKKTTKNIYISKQGERRDDEKCCEMLKAVASDGESGNWTDRWQHEY